MYPDYGEYWESIYANPERVPPLQERIPSRWAPADCSPDSPGQGPSALQRRQQTGLARSRPGEVDRVRQSSRDAPNLTNLPRGLTAVEGPGADEQVQISPHYS